MNINRSRTITDAVLMIRPKKFGFNPETATSNAFQNNNSLVSLSEIQAKALSEFDEMVSKLRNEGIHVVLVEDIEEKVLKDSVFPNNWFTTHADGKIISYPMFAVSRRQERREDIIENLTEEFGYKNRYAFEYLEEQEQFLEGTGSMVLDRDNKIIYACLSNRTSIEALEKCCVLLGYRKIIFHAVDSSQDPIYHTNVMMCMGKDFVVVCLEAIQDELERKELTDSITRSSKEIIEISMDQMNAFAGNMLQLYREDGSTILVLSDTALQSLEWGQLDILRSKTTLLPVSIPTIEFYGGGSVRCMMAEIFHDQ